MTRDAFVFGILAQMRDGAEGKRRRRPENQRAAERGDTGLSHRIPPIRVGPRGLFRRFRELRRRRDHIGPDMGLEPAEIVAEHSYQLLRLHVIRAVVRPGLARI